MYAHLERQIAIDHGTSTVAAAGAPPVVPAPPSMPTTLDAWYRGTTDPYAVSRHSPWLFRLIFLCWLANHMMAVRLL